MIGPCLGQTLIWPFPTTVPFVELIPLIFSGKEYCRKILQKWNEYFVTEKPVFLFTFWILIQLFCLASHPKISKKAFTVDNGWRASQKWETREHHRKLWRGTKGRPIMIQVNSWVHASLLLSFLFLILSIVERTQNRTHTPPRMEQMVVMTTANVNIGPRPSRGLFSSPSGRKNRELIINRVRLNLRTMCLNWFNYTLTYWKSDNDHKGLSVWIKMRGSFMVFVILQLTDTQMFVGSIYAILSTITHCSAVDAHPILAFVLTILWTCWNGNYF